MLGREKETVVMHVTTTMSPSPTGREHIVESRGRLRQKLLVAAWQPRLRQKGRAGSPGNGHTIMQDIRRRLTCYTPQMVGKEAGEIPSTTAKEWWEMVKARVVVVVESVSPHTPGR